MGIVAMTGSVRVVVSMVLLYKFAIAVVVLSLGSRLLVSSSSFADTLLNAMTLHFVVKIDEMIFKSFLPTTAQETVKNTVLFLASPKSTVGTRQAITRKQRKEAVLCICFGLLFVPAYVCFFQSVLPTDLTELRQLCAEHLQYPSECKMRAIQLQFDQVLCYP